MPERKLQEDGLRPSAVLDTESTTPLQPASQQVDSAPAAAPLSNSHVTLPVAQQGAVPPSESVAPVQSSKDVNTSPSKPKKWKTSMQHAVKKIALVATVSKSAVLTKLDNAKLGLKLGLDKSSKAIVIKGVTPNSLAGQSGKFVVGEVITHINSESLAGLSESEVLKRVASANSLDFTMVAQVAPQAKQLQASAALNTEPTTPLQVTLLENPVTPTISLAAETQTEHRFVNLTPSPQNSASWTPLRDDSSLTPVAAVQVVSGLECDPSDDQPQQPLVLLDTSAASLDRVRSPRTLVVKPLDGGPAGDHSLPPSSELCFHTIEEAINASSYGDLITVMPGEYTVTETLELPNNVTLQGMPTVPESVVIISSASPSMLCSQPAAVAYLTIKLEQWQTESSKVVLSIRSAGYEQAASHHYFHASNCCFFGRITVAGEQLHAVIDKCSIAACPSPSGSPCISISGGAAGRVTGNTVRVVASKTIPAPEGATTVGIVVSGLGTKPCVSSNLVDGECEGLLLVGLKVEKKAAGFVVKNRVERCSGAGISISGGANPLVESNFISQCHTGIVVTGLPNSSDASDEEEIRDLFHSTDADGSGAIDFTELMELIAGKMTTTNISSRDVKIWTEAKFAELDTDGNGSLDFDEFVPMYNAALDHFKPAWEPSPIVSVISNRVEGALHRAVLATQQVSIELSRNIFISNPSSGVADYDFDAVLHDTTLLHDFAICVELNDAISAVLSNNLFVSSTDGVHISNIVKAWLSGSDLIDYVPHRIIECGVLTAKPLESGPRSAFGRRAAARTKRFQPAATETPQASAPPCLRLVTCMSQDCQEVIFSHNSVLQGGYGFVSSSNSASSNLSVQNCLFSGLTGPAVLFHGDEHSTCQMHGSRVTWCLAGVLACMPAALDVNSNTFQNVERNMLVVETTGPMICDNTCLDGLHGIEVRDCNGSHVERNAVRMATGCAITLLRCADSVAAHNKLTSVGTGVLVNDCAGVQVLGNAVSHAMQNGIRCIQTVAGPDVKDLTVRIVDNVVSDSSNTGILCDLPAYSNTEISNNTISSAEGTGICFQCAEDDAGAVQQEVQHHAHLHVVANAIQECKIGLQFLCLVWNCSVTDNVISHSRTHGVVVHEGAYDLTLQYNTVSLSHGTGVVLFGGDADVAHAEISLFSNAVRENSGAGVCLFRGAKVFVRHCLLQSNQQHADCLVNPGCYIKCVAHGAQHLPRKEAMKLCKRSSTLVQSLVEAEPPDEFYAVEGDILHVRPHSASSNAVCFSLPMQSVFPSLQSSSEDSSDFSSDALISLQKNIAAELSSSSRRRIHLKSKDESEKPGFGPARTTHEVFRCADKSKTGVLSIEDFCSLSTLLRLNATRDLMEELFNSMDVEHKGSLCYRDLKRGFDLILRLHPQACPESAMIATRTIKPAAAPVAPPAKVYVSIDEMIAGTKETKAVSNVTGKANRRGLAVYSIPTVPTISPASLATFSKSANHFPPLQKAKYCSDKTVHPTRREAWAAQHTQRVKAELSSTHSSTAHSGRYIKDKHASQTRSLKISDKMVALQKLKQLARKDAELLPPPLSETLHHAPACGAQSPGTLSEKLHHASTHWHSADVNALVLRRASLVE